MCTLYVHYQNSTRLVTIWLLGPEHTTKHFYLTRLITFWVYPKVVVWLTISTLCVPVPILYGTPSLFVLLDNSSLVLSLVTRLFAPFPFRPFPPSIPVSLSSHTRLPFYLFVYIHLFESLFFSPYLFVLVKTGTLLNKPKRTKDVPERQEYIILNRSGLGKRYMIKLTSPKRKETDSV